MEELNIGDPRYRVSILILEFLLETNSGFNQLFAKKALMQFTNFTKEEWEEAEEYWIRDFSEEPIDLIASHSRYINYYSNGNIYDTLRKSGITKCGEVIRQSRNKLSKERSGIGPASSIALEQGLSALLFDWKTLTNLYSKYLVK